MNTAKQAQGKWHGILVALGVDAAFLRNKHGPCPLCGGEDRFRFDDKDGRGTWYCNHCGPGDGMELVKRIRGVDFRDAAKEVDAIVGTVKAGAIHQKRDPLPLLRRIQDGLQDVRRGDPVSVYLASRGFDVIPAALKIHPSMTYFADGGSMGSFPCMVARVVSPTGDPLTFHLTYLTPDGKKAPVESVRKLMPATGPLAGAAIRLTPVRPDISVAEGIETALAVGGWACVSATLLAQFVPPAGVKSVTVCGDNDANYTGQAAAYTLARRMVLSGLRSEVRIPTEIGTDFADL